MPIVTSPFVNLDAFNVEMVELETLDLASPLTWSPDTVSRNNLQDWVIEWRRAHPIRIDDDPMIVVTREILIRIHVVLLNPWPSAAQEIEYDVVMRQIDYDSRIVGELRNQCLAIFDQAWCRMANVLECAFTKYPLSDDD